MKQTPLGPGQKSLERRSTFKVPRATMRRKHGGRPSERVRLNMAAFKAATVYLPCVVCGAQSGWGRPIHAHHVVYRQHLPVEREWDPRNAAPVCDGCHERHHNASRRIPLAALSEENLEFAREVLGTVASVYLARRYALPVGASQ